MYSFSTKRNGGSSMRKFKKRATAVFLSVAMMVTLPGGGVVADL